MKKTIAQLKKTLTLHFNKFIRLRDCPEGWGHCISCRKAYPIKKMHAGHYIASTYSAVRFSEWNVNAQCGFNCNMNKRGNTIEYRINLINKIGEDNVIFLEDIRNDPVKWDRTELEEKIEYYKNLCKEY